MIIELILVTLFTNESMILITATIITPLFFFGS